MIKCIFSLVIVAISFQINAQKDSLQVGDKIPSFSGYDQDSVWIESNAVLKDSSLVLIFYRGSWCPYCQKHLSSLQDSLSFITQKGAKIIVVTPEKYVSQEKIIEKSGATYSIIYDQDYIIMKKFKVDFEISNETVPRYLLFVRSKTRKANENEDDILPIPATYVINKRGEITYKHYDPDYRNRSSVKDILEHL